MASLFHDGNFNAHLNGSGTVKADFTAQRKGRTGGRKPLGDLSNAGKPMNQVAGKKALDGLLNTGKSSVLKPKNPTVIINDEAVSKAKNPESNKRTVSKASEKSRTGTRKALSDISNAGKPHVPEIKQKNSLKQSRESLHPSAIAEEGFLHNHQECIKSQFQTVDRLQFFKTVGLVDDFDDQLAISFEQPGIRKLESGSEDAFLELLEEEPEWLSEVRNLSPRHGSPEHCKTPKLSSCSTMWDDFSVDFKLKESP